MAYVRFNGSPGETWTNDTGKVQYQLIVNWQNSCGLCAQYDHAIGNSWPIPFHYNCMCKSVPIYPNGESLPFVDFREKIADLDEAQRANLVGRSNLKLIDAGVVRWDDVVTQGRILDLREVVSAKRLSVERMVDAGVSRGVAEKAWEAVHTLAHEQAFDARREAIGRLRDLGVRRETARRLVAERLASRVSVAAGPSGPQTAPLPPAALAAALGVKLVPPPEPPKGLTDDQRRRWSEAYEAALQRGLSVREARRTANEAVRLGA